MYLDPLEMGEMFWGIIGEVPGVSKSKRLFHVDNFRFFFIILRYLP